MPQPAIYNVGMTRKSGAAGTIFFGVLLTLLLPTSLGVVADSGESLGYTPHSPIFIEGDADFTGENGVVAGSGTGLDPYVIEGWEINASSAHGIEIRDTDAHFIIRDVYVHSGGSSWDGLRLSLVVNGSVRDSMISGNRWGLLLNGGFSLFGGSPAENVGIANNDVSGNEFGIEIRRSSDVEIESNNLSSNRQIGITIVEAAGVSVAGNGILGNAGGVAVFDSTEITVANNTFVSGGLTILGRDAKFFNTHTITPDNQVNGKPLLYYKDCSGLEVDGVSIGQLIVANCTDLVVTNLEFADAGSAIQLGFIENGLLQANTVSDSGTGFSLSSSSNITIRRNHLSGNGVGVYYGDSTRLTVYHNNLIENVAPAWYDPFGEKDWDDGYPRGGNYWSGYAGEDRCSGPDQDVCPDSDGVGDTPYSPTFGVEDRYPLMEPYSPVNTPPVAAFVVSSASSNGTTLVTVDASATFDAEDSASRLEVRWDWEDDGVWDTSWSIEKTAQHLYAVPGRYSLRLEARDTAGVSNQMTKLVDVPDTLGPAILHAPPTSALVGQPLLITASVTDYSAVEEVRVFYRSAGETDFSSVLMEPIGNGTYHAAIPPQAAEGRLEYYIVATDRAGNAARSPVLGEYSISIERPGFVPALVFGAVMAAVGASALILAYMVIRRKRRDVPPSSKPDNGE